jgi:hypothetical protein
MGRLGWTITTDIEKADICFWWKFTAEHEELPEILKDKVCINRFCTSTLKTDVEMRVVNAFGVRTFVNPRTYVGMVVKKSNLNATHDGEIIDCPTTNVDDGYVYQRFLGYMDNITNLRVPVIGGEVPYVSVQHKNHLFKGIIHGGVDWCEIKDPSDVFTKEWLGKLRNFCNGYVDIAEIDVIDGFILDVNNTPSEVSHFDEKDRDYCRDKYANLVLKHYGRI